MEGVLLKLQEQLGQRLTAQCGVNENYDDRTEQNPGDVEQRSQPAPSRLAGVVENRMRHANETKDILAVELGRIKPQEHL
jgi:hypothetical protein